MRVLLVGPNYEDNLSIRYLAASLEAAGHEAHVSAFNSAADIAAVAERARRYDMVGLSISFQVRAREFLALADALADDDGPIVIAGGHYASCAAEDLLRHHPAIDLVVLYEGEHTLVDLANIACDRARLGQVQGIVFRSDDGTIVRTAKRRVLEDLDQLPSPDRSGSVHFFAGVPTAYLIGSRGCVASCDYCCIVTLHRMAEGRRFRQRSPELVADEMAKLYHAGGIRHFIFHDDNFLVPSVSANLRRVNAFDDALRRRDVTDIGITLKGRPADATRPVLERMKELGLLRIFLGVESSSPEGLHAIGRDQTVDESERALEICTDLGISAQYTIMAFHPDATLQTLRSDLAFMRRHVDYPLNFARTEIYAGTPLEQRMIAEGRARGDYLARSYSFESAEVERAWCGVRRVFRERAWATRGLMDRTIGLDHLSAVLGHFYRGRDVTRLREQIRAWRLNANRDLVDLLEETIETGAALTGTALDQKLAELVEREQRSRGPLLERALELKAALEKLARKEIGLGDDGSILRSFGREHARHAAAVFLALGLAACGGSQQHDGIAEAAPDPLGNEHGGGPDPIDHDGIAEAAPDPLLHDGIAEAAPDPLYHDGIAEAAPDPLDVPQPAFPPLRGRVTSAGGPVAATIRVPALNLEAHAAQNGTYSLTLPNGRHVVIFSVPGHAEERRTVTVQHGGQLNLNVQMRRTVQ